MIWSHQVPSTNLDWRYVLGEIKELIDEIKQGNIKGIIEELSDVYTCGACAITRYTKLPIPIFWELTYHKYIDRVEFFKWYLNQLGLEYQLKYLRYGGNYDRDWKRIRAIRLAVKDQFK